MAAFKYVTPKELANSYRVDIYTLFVPRVENPGLKLANASGVPTLCAKLFYRQR